MEEFLSTYTAADPPNPAPLAVQMAGELPAQAAAAKHTKQVPRAAALPTSSRGVATAARAAKSSNSSWKTALHNSSSSNKRVICIVAGDDGSHVPILRQVRVYGEEAAKGYEKAADPPGNLVKKARGDVGKQTVRRTRAQLNSNNREERSTEFMDDDEEASLALQVKLERITSSVDHSLRNAEEHDLYDIMEIGDESSDDTDSESDSDSSSGSESEGEKGKFFYPDPKAVGHVKAPQVGMKFPTLEDAHDYYNTYALQTGFVVVRGRNYKRQRFQLDCNRNRKVKLVEDLNLKRKRKKNVIEKTNCQAKIIVKLTKGQWVITAVQNEHNHPLSPRRSFTRFLTSQKHMSAEERSFSRVLQQSRVPPGEILKILRRMSGFFRELPSNAKHARIAQSAEQWRKVNSDVEKALNHFEELQLQDPCFLYTVQKDEEGTVRSIFWTEAKSRMDYEIFGDFISFDTTCSTNRHNMPTIPITGINNRGRTIVLGCALLQDRKAETYKWMLQTFLQEMGGHMPGAIITNQDEAMEKAIAEVMPQARHRFCRWDVLGKAQEKMAAFMAARGNMKAELDSLVDNSLTEMEFEEGWSALLRRHDASGNEYLEFLWEMRRKWAPVYFMEDFFPFVVSARGSQGAISLFKENVIVKDRIERLIERYEEMQDKIRKTDEEDLLQSASEPSCFSLQPIEKDASRIYTREIFLKVQKELLHSTAFKVQEIESGTLYRLVQASSYENPEYNRDSFEVSVERGTDSYKCQCAKFTRDGILCCHVLRLFTQFGVDEIPGGYIVARWTDQCREEAQLELPEVGWLVARREEDAARYAALMSKAAGIGREVCGDGAKCDAFMLELDRIRERLAAVTVENPGNL